MLIQSLYLQVAWSALIMANGIVNYDQLPVNGRYPVSTRASFTCGQLYYPIGSDSSTCHSSGNWDSPTLICEGDVMFCFFFISSSKIALMTQYCEHNINTGDNISQFRGR